MDAHLIPLRGIKNEKTIILLYKMKKLIDIINEDFKLKKKGKINKANYDILGIAKDEVVTRHKQKYLK